jgi:RNA polymerase sigma-70 factor (ECF subfamily)
VEEKDLIRACRKGDRQAQRRLYERYAPKMLGLCRRYVPVLEDAEDVLLEAFYKVFTHLDRFRGDGSFEGWIRRIVVNEALMFLRKRNNFRMTVEITEVEMPTMPNVVSQLAEKDILDLLDQLPHGYRTVFNLFVIEGYKHREIADMLGISINTSKSQLILAKKRMRELVLKTRDEPGELRVES